MDFGFRVYISISDVYGNPQIMDKELEPYRDIINKSIKINFDYFDIGDYCIPFSNKNLMLFKISKKGVVILFADKGNIAQLLSFKKNINYFGEQIDKLLIDIQLPAEAVETTVETEKRKIEKKEAPLILGKELPVYYPVLNSEIIGKAKVTVDDMRFLQLCDGKHSFSDLVHQLKQSENYIYEFILKQLKKKWILQESIPLTIECPDCKLKLYLFILERLFKKDDETLKILIRSEKCNHEFVVFVPKKSKMDIQSFRYFTDFQKDKFMKRLEEHYYMIIS